MLKEFGPAYFKVKENVAEEPSLLKYYKSDIDLSGMFCLRIDADEYDRDSFDKYYELFGAYKEALTIFFNAVAFKDAKLEIQRLNAMEVDIQSHGYYHYTYSDYASNRHNIAKAKSFFSSLGVKTKGFAAPMGKWNFSLLKALEAEGYEYSSDFYYDYMGYPHYPEDKGKVSKVMEIPVFPVAPELFFESKKCELRIVEEYYRRAIDIMIKAKLPVIIYAHTNPGMPMIPDLVSKIAYYAVNYRKLKPITMTGIYEYCMASIENKSQKVGPPEDAIMPYREFLGETVKTSLTRKIKNTVKNSIDFEKITPAEELKCGKVKKMLKLFARSVIARSGATKQSKVL